MRNFLIAFFVLGFSFSAFATTKVTPIAAKPAAGTPGIVEEDWKGKPLANKIDAGVLMGLGIIDTTGGFAILGTAAYKFMPEGFIPDINDTASLEFEGGPVFLSGASPFMYSAHLRWDFGKDRTWSLYSLAGFGGNITGGRFALHPRVGIGAMAAVHDLFSLRGEFSHELVGVGLLFFF